MRLATVSLLIALTASASAQTPDPNPPSAYFPLAVGDEWQYVAGSFEVVPRILARAVEGEVVINDTTYARLRERGYDTATGAPTYDREQLLRVDATSGDIRERRDGSDQPSYEVTCPLNTPFPDPNGEPIACSSYGDFFGFVVYGEPASGDTRAFKVFDSLAGGQEVAAGIGLTRFAGDASEGHDLRYARVRQADGSIYQQGAVIIADETAPTAPALVVTASPNPTAGALRLAVTVPSVGALTVDAFDAIGRRVYHATRNAVGGPLSLDVDASGWAPGAYIVRVRTADGTATERVVRR